MDKLADTYFFKDLEGDEIETLKRITEIRDVEKSERILNQGQPSDRLFIVRTGSVRVLLPMTEEMQAEDIEEQTLVTLGPGECFGEFAFVDRNPTSAAVEAAEDGSVYVIKHADLDATLLANPPSAVKILRALLHILVERFRNTDIELAMRRAFGS